MASTSSSSSATSSGAVALLSQCFANIVSDDADYALCLMNTGFFAITSDPRGATSWVSASNAAAMLLQLVGAGKLRSDTEVGTCTLLCTTTATTASSSCCDAAQAVQACKPTATSLAYCQQVINDSFALASQCGLSSATITLIAVSAVVVCVLVLLAVVARVFAKRQCCASTAITDRDVIESRFAAATASTWRAVLAAWHQITNLVWKNVVLRRRKPFAFVLEQLLPLVLVTGLVFIANLDTLFGLSNQNANDWNDAATTKSDIFCTGIASLDNRDIGVLSDTMTTFYSSGQTVIGMFLLLSYIKFVATTTTAMVLEKETRMREVMKIMGLTDMTILASWVVTTALFTTPVAFAIAAELKYGRVFGTAEFATLVALFWALGLVIVAFSYCIAPFFNKSRSAAIASVLVWLVLFFPFFHVQPKTAGIKFAAALAPPTAFALAIDDLLRHAQRGTGIAAAIAALEAPMTTVPSAAAMTWMLLLDALLLFLIGWYCEQVVPQQFGVQRPWDFLFYRSYWVGKQRAGALPTSNAARHGRHLTAASFSASSRCDSGNYAAAVSPHLLHRMASLPLPMLQHQASSVSSNDSVMFVVEQSASNHQFPLQQSTIEPVSKALARQEQTGACLQLFGLRKVFSAAANENDDATPARVAVASLDLTLYAGHITALLGHNGAGKTTTIAMLTGLIPPTAGDATLFGRSLTNEMPALRQIMGICPQHDVLLPDLTVSEHLELFGTMKHVAPQLLAAAVDQLLTDVGLHDKRQTKSKDLSGGQKRKLSVALAFIGDSKLVFLDEPTSGMDPYSRRFTWNLLQRQRADRVIVLTTHFMDEADILGDRIAILADGKLECVGSPLFLKTRFGAGYNLTLLIGQNCSIETVTAFLQTFVAAAVCLRTNGHELVFQLPTAACGQFSRMLEALDAQLHLLGIVQYGISVTTLEEVFLRIANDREDVVTDADNVGVLLPPPHSVDTERCRSRHAPTFGAQLTALLLKRLRITRRDRKSWTNAVAIPLLFLLLLVLLPEIDVANFLPNNYATSIASSAEQANCTAANFSTVAFDASKQQRCVETTFDYCALGVIDCDASVCCDKQHANSPYYACNLCARSSTRPLVPQTPCYNSNCLEKDGAKLQATLNGFIVAIVVMLAFAFIPAAIVAFVVKEKAPNQDAKSLQLICGTRPLAFWLSNWLHDISLVTVSVAAATLLIPLSNRALADADAVAGVAALVSTHALAVVPLAYVFAFRFDRHAVAQTSLLVFALATGGLLSIFSFLCRIIDFELVRGGLTLAALDRNYLRWLFLAFPGYGLTNGLYEIASRQLSRSALFGSNSDSAGGSAAPATFFGLFEGLGRDPTCVSCWTRNTAGCCTRNVFDLDVAGAPVLYGLVEALVLALVVLAIEQRRKSWPRERRRVDKTTLGRRDEDDDVQTERQRVDGMRRSRSTDRLNDRIVIQNLRHAYKSKVALESLSLAIPRGECFGYLGINGAGKSTTMKVLTGQLTPSSGFVALDGVDVAKHRTAARRVIGYCPQFDALHDLLTVREQLELFARLKGIAPHAAVAAAVAQTIEDVGLAQYANSLTRSLSGGNKRKVSTAIALIGDPTIVFLDEPTTGVDPSARRKLWDVIAAVCVGRNAASVLLTTHSMDECEALCSRVGMLVNGALQCLGSVAHLKHKFGRGFTVDVTLQEPKAKQIAHVSDAIQRIVLANSSRHDTTTREGVGRNHVTLVCDALGRAERSRLILSGERTGWMLASFLESGGTSNSVGGAIPLDVLSAWWLSEDQSDALQHLFSTELPGSVLVERQSDHFRFHVPTTTVEESNCHPQARLLKPHEIFGLLEAHRVALAIDAYSVSATSLEHIFNHMAAAAAAPTHGSDV